MITKRHGKLVPFLMKTSDITAAAAAWLAAAVADHVLGHPWTPSGAMAELHKLLPAAALSLALLIPIFGQFDLYKPKRMKSIAPEAWGLARAVAIVWGLTYVAMSFIPAMAVPAPLAHAVLASWLIIAMCDRLSARALLRWMRKRGWNLQRAAVVGAGRLGQRTVHMLRSNVWMGIEPLYFVSDRKAGQSLMGLNILGNVDSLAETINANPVDIVFVALSGRGHEQADSVLSQLASTAADVRVVPDLLSMHFLKHDITLVDNLPIITLTYSPQHGWNGLLKRLFDVIVAGAGLAIMAVPMLVVAAAIRLTSPGPVFYRQRRAGLGTQPFTIIKFRTMVDDAERGLGPVWTSQRDPRVTRIGRLLRRTSMDELPQLLNVLIGHMSLVGPRPERPELIERFRRTIPRYMLRHQVKAGLTGWAQVHGLRGPTSLRKRIQYDLYYITNWSFGLDLRIMAMTMFGAIINRQEE
jgi:Undecaprenyl-phosphate glucose phosphotransferase